MLEINKIHQGKSEELFKNLEDNSIDLIVSDPPYLVEFQNNKHYDDTKEGNDYELWIREMARVLKDGSHIYLYVPSIEIDLWVAVVKKYLKFNNLISTEVYGNATYTPNNFGHELQLIIYASKGKAKHLNKVDFQPSSGSWQNDKRNPNPQPYTYKYSNVISKDLFRSTVKFNKQRKALHPNEKNHKLIEKFIELSSNVGDLVLDPFSGSASTAFAAKNVGRNFIGFEQHQKFIDAGNERLFPKRNEEIIEENKLDDIQDINQI